MVTERGYHNSKSLKIAKRPSDKIPFPWKLHVMLDCADDQSYAQTVSWMPDGKSFKVHNVYAFVAIIMPRYFKQTKYKSFQRQLNVWCFERIKQDSNKGAYTHPHFERGQHDLCHRMVRRKIKGISAQSVAASFQKNLEYGIDQPSVGTPKTTDIKIVESRNMQDIIHNVDEHEITEQDYVLDEGESRDWLPSYDSSLLGYDCNELLDSFELLKDFPGLELADEQLSSSANVTVLQATHVQVMPRTA